MTLLAALLLTACSGPGDTSAGPQDPMAGEDIHYYEPGNVPEELASGDGADGTGTGPDGGTGDGTEPVYVGEFLLEAWTLGGTLAGSCEGDAVLRRGETRFTGTLACEGTGGLEPLGSFVTEVMGDAAGDGTLTLEVETDPIQVILTGTFDDIAVDLEGEGPAQIGGADLDLRGVLTCRQAGQ